MVLITIQGSAKVRFQGCVNSGSRNLGVKLLPNPGMNCIQIGLPGKQGSDPEGEKPLEKSPENPPENKLEISYTGKSPKIGSLDMS